MFRRNLQLSKVSNIPLGVGRAAVSICSELAWVKNVICATIGKWVGCGFEYGGYRRVRVGRMRPMQDSAGSTGRLRTMWQLSYQAAEVKTKESVCTGNKLAKTCCAYSLT